MVPAQTFCHGDRPRGNRDEFLQLLRCQPQPRPYRCILREPAVRAFAENAAIRPGLRLAAEQLEELVAVAPWAIAMAKRLRRDHLHSAEVSSIFDPTR